MRMQPGRRFCFAAAAMLALSVSQPSRPAGAQASDYPARKVTFIVGFAPGGGVDTMARIVAQGLAEQLGYQIVVENRPGAASNIAAKAVASAVPDGYTFLFTGNSLAINQTFYKNLTYSIDELRAVAVAAIDSQALAVNAGRPARTLRGFLDAAGGETFTFGYGGRARPLVGPGLGVRVDEGALESMTVERREISYGS